MNCKTKKHTTAGKSAAAYIPTKDDEKLLRKLNAIYRKLSANHRKITRAYDSEEDNVAEIERLNNDGTAILRRFNDLIACMPPVKFNAAAGEYIFKYDQYGIEVFAIRVIKTETYDIILSAQNEDSAVEAATKSVKSGQLNHPLVNITVSNLTADAN